MSKPVILTGIRANNDITIGNYFGAILPMIDMAKSKSDDYQINMFIPDLHSFTTPIDHSKLYDQIIHTAKLFVAAGLPLDNPSINLYRQSQISAHSELTLILDCFTRIGELGRMTQLKDKSEQERKKEIEDSALLKTLLELKTHSSTSIPDYLKRSAAEELNRLRDILIETKLPVIAQQIEEIRQRSMAESTKYLTQILDLYKELNEEAIGRGPSTVGLFNYPVLMASDILLYNAKYVPVGDDQSQHLEFTRDIAERMNAKFGDLFTVPEAVKAQHEFFGNDQGLRIKDLVDPKKKMSKSDESDKGVIFLGDDPVAAAKKVMSATTDDKGEIHFDKENQPGISNLLEILALLQGRALQEVISEFEGQTSYGNFKAVVAGEVEKFLTDFQQKLASVDENAVIAKLEQSERDLTPIASATLLRVQQAVGLRQKS